ncbi:protein LOL4-like isoform X2 [Phragmites australis]|uniref:protein LOL4-like isoform X2 n=1 Tax=Phragmites australis TaxID=29695 RepID=UPI002D78F915|nr:protein LOL4-like isoform X2 [Phragmites australis]
MQNQLICSGCKRVLQYRRGTAGVCCPGCNTFTSVNPSGAEMSEIVCSRCYTLLIYNRGAANIRCPNCSMVNSTRSGANQICHLSCGHCRTTLAYQLGASTVGCPTCRYVNPVRNNTGGSARPAPSDARPQTVLVENPKTLDEKGRLVSNVVVGITSWKR